MSGTEKIAFRMFLNPGAQVEYRRRHAAIWPELVTLLKASGIEDYSIYLDEAHGTLFAVLRRVPGHTMDELPKHPVMQRWWDYMAPLMEVEPGNRPVEWPLVPLFHLA